MPEEPYIFLNPDDTQNIGLCLIVEHPSGVRYASQVAGYLTDEKSVEGFLIPLGCHDIEDALYSFFWSEFHGNCYHPHNLWTAERTSQLSELVSRITCWSCHEDKADTPARLALDESRMDECVEAWIPVVSAYGRAILTLQNSD